MSFAFGWRERAQEQLEKRKRAAEHAQDQLRLLEQAIEAHDAQTFARQQAVASKTEARDALRLLDDIDLGTLLSIGKPLSDSEFRAYKLIVLGALRWIETLERLAGQRTFRADRALKALEMLEADRKR